MNFKLLTLIVLILTLTGCAKPVSSNKEIVKIGYLPITHAIPLFIQKEMLKDSDKHYDIELVRFSSWEELVDAIRLGHIEGASMLFELAIKASESSDGLKLVSLSHRDGNIVTSLPSINTVHDLKGKKVAIPNQISPHNMLLHMLLEQNDMTVDDVDVVLLSPAEMPTSLKTKSIAAYLVAEPFGSIAIDVEVGKALALSNEFAPDSICCTIVFRTQFIEQNKETVNDFVEMFHQAGEIAEKKDSYVIDTFKKYSGTKESVLVNSLNITSFTGLDISEDEYNDISSKIIEYNILDSVPSYADFVFTGK